MTESPSAPRTAPTARHSPALTAIAWLVILSIVAYSIAGQFTQRSADRKAHAGTPDAQFGIIGKYVVGAHLLASGASGPTTAPIADALMPQLDKLAVSPRNRVQAAIVAAEIAGKEAALKRLHDLPAQTQSPQLDQDIASLKSIYSSSADALDAEARRQLQEHQGYFGKLADTFGMKDSVEPRQSLLKAARRSAILLGVGTVAVILAAAGGVVLLVLGIVLLATGVIRRHYRPDPAAPGVFVEMFAVYLGSFFGISRLIAIVAAGHGSLWLSWITTLSLPLALGWGLFRGVRWPQLRQALGWHGGKGWYAEIPLGIVGYVAGLPVVALGLLVTKYLIGFTDSLPTHPIISVPTDSLPQALNLLAIASIWAPIMEETMFRGALMHHMRRRWNWLISAAVVAFVFAAIHPQGWATIPVLGSIAIVLAGIREWRGSLLASITAHGCNNFVLVCLLLALK